MPKVQAGKEIQSERARPGRSNIRPQLRALISCCYLFARDSELTVKSSRFNDLTFQRLTSSLPVKPSQTQSSQIKPPLPLLVKKPVKKW